MMTIQSMASKGDSYVDRIGTFASATCAVHCAVCALLPAAFTVLGLGFLLGHEVEWVLTGFAASFGALAFVLGWRRHRKMLVFVMLAVGIVGLLGARLAVGDGHHHGHDHHAAQVPPVKDSEHGEAAGAHEHADHNDEPGHHDGAEHHDEVAHHDEEEHESHGPGEGLGVVAGLILMMGHLANFREIRRAHDASHADTCCDAEDT